MRRAVALSTGTLCVAVAIGIASAAFAAPPGVSTASQLASAFLPSLPAELRPDALVPSRGGGRDSRLMVIPVDEQVLSAGREAAEAEVEAEAEAPPAPPAPTPAPRAAALTRTTTTSAPPLQPGDRVEASLSFYYCERGASAWVGDGGGFCGKMRNGEVVHAGAAACHSAFLGQRFRIVGDPLQREYVCADTGSAVRGLHRDIWFMTSDEGLSWQQAVGQSAIIEILP